jgi:hypothetical protein
MFSAPGQNLLKVEDRKILRDFLCLNIFSSLTGNANLKSKMFPAKVNLTVSENFPQKSSKFTYFSCSSE